jgi:hypothetical protein
MEVIVDRLNSDGWSLHLFDFVYVHGPSRHVTGLLSARSRATTPLEATGWGMKDVVSHKLIHLFSWVRTDPPLILIKYLLEFCEPW